MLPDDRKNNSPYFIGNIMKGITESLKSLSLFYGKGMTVMVLSGFVSLL